MSNSDKPEKSNFATLGTARTDLAGVGDATVDTIHRLHRSGSKPLVFIRHSAREYGKAFNDLDNPLSDPGRALASSLGQRLPAFDEIVTWTSPSGRCVETAELIAAGSPMSAQPNQTHEDLSVFYVRDMRRVGGMLKHQGSDATLSAWFRGEVDANWMTPASASANRLIARLAHIRDSAEPGQLTLVVSHDWNLYLLRTLLLGTPFGDLPQPEYLEALAIWEDGGALMASDPHHVPQIVRL